MGTTKPFQFFFCLPDTHSLARFIHSFALFRHQAVVLVCRRLRQLAEQPALNASVSLHLFNKNGLPQLRSLLSWVQAGAARHVRHLALRFPFRFSLNHAGCAELCSLLASILTACGTMSCLEKVQLGRLPPCVELGPWMGTLQQLRCLGVSTHGEGLYLTASLHPLTALERLQLHGEYMHLSPGVGLPPSVTCLHLGGDYAEQLPQQVCPPFALDAAISLFWWRRLLAASGPLHVSLSSLWRCIISCSSW